MILDSLYAAPAMQGSLCEIKAIVKKIETRKDDYSDRPKSWKEDWGISSPVVYNDITLKVLYSKELVKGSDNCKTFVATKKFQLKRKESKPKFGDCILAQTKFSGDEFLIGQWLFKIKQLKPIDCQKM